MCMNAGEFQCPVLNKVFTEFTHIVAVKTTGNVFCYEVCFSVGQQFSQTFLQVIYGFYAYILYALCTWLTQAIKELNIKTKNWKELLTDEPFTKDDLITIQVVIALRYIKFVCTKIISCFCLHSQTFYICYCTLQNPNALDSKVLLDFDHVKKSLKVDDEGQFSLLVGSIMVRMCFDLFMMLTFYFPVPRTKQNEFRSNL